MVTFITPGSSGCGDSRLCGRWRLGHHDQAIKQVFLTQRGLTAALGLFDVMGLFDVICTRRTNDRFSGGELGEIPVIARSETTTQFPARESWFTRRVGDCFVASLLAMTGGRYPFAYVNLFGAWYNSVSDATLTCLPRMPTAIPGRFAAGRTHDAYNRHRFVCCRALLYRGRSNAKMRPSPAM